MQLDEPSAPTPIPAVADHELDAPPWHRVESTLMATARLIREAYDRRLAPLDLNLTQATILAYLAEFGAATQTMIAGHLGQGRAATGVTIDRLHERGMVTRMADPVDRRVWIVRLTPIGFDLVGRITTVDEVLRGELREGIPRSERRALTVLLQRLQENLHSAITS